MRHRLGTTAMGAMTIALIASGCTDTQAGVPSAPPGTTTTNSSAPNRHGAPTVAKPLDASRFLTQPCSTLDSSQLASMGLPAQGLADTTSAIATSVGPSCNWLNSETAHGLNLVFVTGNENGLADFYRAHQDGDFQGLWIETTVDDYPAVFMSVTDSRKSGNCGISVGISDTVTFNSRVQSRLGEKSCDQAKQAASLVLGRLRAGG
jgi:hypothetical protein